MVSKEADRAENVPAADPAHKAKLVFFYSEQSGRSRRVEGFLAQVLQRRQNHETFELVRVSVERHPERFSRKARRPSCPSSLVRRSAIQRAVSGPSGRSRTSRFAQRAACGPAERSSPTTRSTARVEIVRHLVHESDPERGLGVEALARHEVAARGARADPCEREGRDDRRDDPELHLREREDGVRARRSRCPPQRRARPRRRGRGPWTRATTGAGQPSIASSMARSAFASATFSSYERSTEERIQSTSAPAEKLGPSPARTTARARPTPTNASASSAMSAASNAFRRSGRVNVIRRTSPSRSVRRFSGTAGL